MSRRAFEAAAESAVAVLGLSRSKDLVGLLARRGTKERALTELTAPGADAAVADLYDAMENDAVPTARRPVRTRRGR
ncbi:hypothetical protein [Streptomyces sp. SAI-229]|uniref:hypothetical protein n=1 Tax=Streptomyces sp. SAI-229 TaxID=3377731 RepID=UPI003C7AD308